MRVGVAGVDGRVGQLLAAELVAASGLTLSGGSVRRGADEPAGRFASIAALAAVSDVVIDFTHADATADHAAALASAGCAWVLGTTGLDPADEAAVLRAAETVPVLRAANFSPGVVLATELARRMAAALPADRFDAEIHETHHRNKRDAPSGTALALGRAVAEARHQEFDAVREDARSGQTGIRRPGSIGFAASRGGQVVGEHTLSFTADDEQLSLVHRAFDRRVFATGAILAARWLGVPGRPAGLYGLEDVLGLRDIRPLS